jgi:hypothetical protein
MLFFNVKIRIHSMCSYNCASKGLVLNISVTGKKTLFLFASQVLKLPSMPGNIFTNISLRDRSIEREESKMPCVRYVVAVKIFNVW